MFFLPDTPRILYAENRFDEADATLCQLTHAPLESEKVQKSKREILAVIEAKLETAQSLRWMQFVAAGIVDRTPMKIIRKLCICFWLPMIREWTGSSLLPYYS